MSQPDSSPLQQPSTSRKRPAIAEEQETPKRPKEPAYLQNAPHKAGGIKLNIHGSIFQVQLLMLSALSFQSDFSLASETLEAEKFDDIAYTVPGEDPEDEPRYCFYQLKHKIGPKKTKCRFTGLGKDSGLHLKIYFHSYLLMKDKYESADYALCTNASFANKSKWRNYLYEIEGSDDLIKVECKRYKFIKDTHKRKELVKEFDLLKPYEIGNSKKKEDRERKIQVDALLEDANIYDHINSFLDTLVLVTNLPSGNDLKQAIEAKIKGKYKKSKTFYDQFYRYMFDWVQYYEPVNKKEGEGGIAYELTKNNIDAFFESLDENRSFSNMFGGTLLKIYEAEKFKIKFNLNDSTITRIKAFESNNLSSEKFLILSSHNEQLTEIKICQTLTWKTKYIDAIYSDLRSLRNLKNIPYCDPLKAFSSNDTKFLIITCGSEPLNNGDQILLQSFYEEAINSYEKKIILTVRPESAGELRYLFKKSSSVINDENDKLDDLDIGSKTLLLQSKMRLFGKKSTLNDIAGNASDSDLFRVIRGTALTALIDLFWKKGIITIGDRYEHDPLHVDITRRVKYPTYSLTNKFWESVEEDVSLIYNGGDLNIVRKEVMFFEKFKQKSEEKKTKSLEIINCIISKAKDYTEAKKDFKFVCNEFCGRSVHLVEYKDDKFIWKQTRGSFFNIRKCMKEEKGEAIEISDLADNAIIIGEPGIGKSTVLNTYAVETQFYWPFKIGLRDLECKIQEASFINLSSVADFLSTFLTIEKLTLTPHSLLKSLIEYSLNQNEHVVLLLDGYDEIVERTQRKIVELMKLLKVANCKVILTSRSYVYKQLEDDTAMFSSTLLPYDEKEQNDFFSDFWAKKFGPDARNRINAFVVELRRHLMMVFEIKELENLVGIALQARMLAEIYESDCSEYLRLKIKPTTKISSGSDLYDKFIDVQFERYLGIKRKPEISRSEKESLFVSYRMAYGNLAVKLLFPQDIYLVTYQKLTDTDLANMGLLLHSKHNDGCKFLHYTYGEYFIAILIVHALREDRSTVSSFIIKHIFKNRNRLILCFIEKLVEIENVVKKKWSDIKNCLWLDNIPTGLAFQSENSDRLIINYDELKEEDLRRLYESYKDSYDYDLSKVNKLKNISLFVTDEALLWIAVNYLFDILKREPNEYAVKARDVYRAVEKYLINANTLQLADEKLRSKSIGDYLIENDFSEYKENINNIKDEELDTIRVETENDYRQLTNYLIPAGNETIKLPSLLDMERFCWFLYLFFPSIISNLKYYIITHTASAREKCDQIVQNIKSMKEKKRELFDCTEPFENLQRFYTNLWYHEPDADFSIEYFEEDSYWLERNGVLMSRLLGTVTSEMADVFISGYTNIYKYYKYGYMWRIWDGLICHMLNTSSMIEFRDNYKSKLKVDKLALLKMVHFFSDSYCEQKTDLIFTSNQLKASLELVRDLLNEKCTADILFHTINFLHFVASKTGYKLFICGKDITIIDPESEYIFKFRYTGVSKNKMNDLMQWRKDNDVSEAFHQKCRDSFQ